MIALTFRVSENGGLGTAGEAGGKAEAGRRGQKAGEWERGQVCRGQDRCTASPGPAIPHSERGNEPAGGNRGVSAAEPGLLEPLAPFRRTEHHLSVRVGSRGEGGWVGRTVGPDRRQPRPSPALRAGRCRSAVPWKWRRPADTRAPPLAFPLSVLRAQCVPVRAHARMCEHILYTEHTWWAPTWVNIDTYVLGCV